MVGRSDCRARACTAPASSVAPVCGAAQSRALRTQTRIAALAVLALLLTGCQSPQARLVIRGGPSLDALFVDLAAAYQKQNPNVTVTTDFTCPPCVLFKRPDAVATFDLFASLGQFELDRLKQVGKIDFISAREIGTTTLALVTSTRSTTPLRSFADLHKGGLRRIGVGHPDEVGVGYYAREGLKKAGLWDELKPHFVYSQSGCELLKWLGLGRDIDAAIVFGVCSGEEQGSIREVIEFPPDLVPPVPLLLGIPAQATAPDEARRFIEFACSEAARPLLARHKVAPVKAP